jgi:hypothetical protein
MALPAELITMTIKISIRNLVKHYGRGERRTNAL